MKSGGFHVKSKDHLQGIVTLFFHTQSQSWAGFLSLCGSVLSDTKEAL